MELTFTWKENTGSFESGESLYLNKIRLGSYSWNSNRSRDKVPRDPDYAGQLNLPSLKIKRVLEDDIESIKAKMEQMVTTWFTEALKKEENGISIRYIKMDKPQ